MVPSLPLLSCESSVSMKENPDRKRNCDLFLAVLVYMQEQQNCFHKTWHIFTEIISNGCSRSFEDPCYKKHPQIKLQRFQKVQIWILLLFVTGPFGEGYLFCMGVLGFQLWYFQQQNGSLVFLKKGFNFSENLFQS